MSENLKCCDNRVSTNSQFLTDILCTAAEGGIGYWCACDTASRDKDGNYLALLGCHDAEDPKEKFENITLDTLRVGIERILSGAVRVRGDLVAQVAEGNAFDDAGNIDAEGADVIVQAGLLNSIVYS